MNGLTAAAWVAAERHQRALPEPIEVCNGPELLARHPAGTDPDEVVFGLVAEYNESTWDGLDLTVWRNGYILAVIRQGRDGGPEVQRFPSEW